MKRIVTLLLLCLLAPGLAQDMERKDIIARGEMVVTKDLLIYQTTKAGEGAVAKPGDEVTVHYTGWLVDMTKFDSSLDRGKPFVFRLGENRVIPGWEKGVMGMKEGETRELIIPSNLAYGSRAAGSLIPPNSHLLFEVQLLKVKKR